MILEVEYKNHGGNINQLIINISNLKIAKHMAIAGQGYLPRITKLRRCIGMFLTYWDYLDNMNNNSFYTPQGYRYDPTEKAQFSNLVGKAIADYLAKQISNARITYNYEGAMEINGFPIRGGRPDLLCDTGALMFAIESKGFSCETVSGNKMNKYKQQSQSGPIEVSFSIASVTYNMYSDIKVKYHDPINKNYKYDKSLSEKLMKKYYSGIMEYIDKDLFDVTEIEINKHEYYKIKMKDKRRGYDNLIGINIHRISILIDKNIKRFINDEIEYNKMFNLESVDEKDIYIDRDGIGIMLGKENIKNLEVKNTNFIGNNINNVVYQK